MRQHDGRFGPMDFIGGKTTRRKTVHIPTADYIDGSFMQPPRPSSCRFTPGSEVKKGDLLFVREPEPYQVKVDQAKVEGIV